MPSVPSRAIVLGFLLLATALVSAQGGRHRGPGTGDVSNHPPPGPRSSHRGLDLSTWRSWWEINQDRFLPTRRTGGHPVEHEAIVRALGEASSQGPARLRAASLLALGKIGRSTADVQLVPLLAAGLVDIDALVRESAVLALGLSGHAAAMRPLTAIALRETGHKEPAVRLRAFALYAIGFLAHNQDRLFQQQAFGIFYRILEGYHRRTHVNLEELYVAAIHGMALLNWTSMEPASDRPIRSLALDLLKELQAVPRPRLPANVLVHIPFAMTRILGRGSSPQHQTAKSWQLGDIKLRRQWDRNLSHSSVLALGQLASSPDRSASDTRYSVALQRYSRDCKDHQAKMFALLALGQIGGRGNESFLLDVLIRGTKAFDRPRAAIALACLHHRNKNRTPKDAHDACAEILKQLSLVRTPQARAGFAIALGILGYRPAAPYLEKLAHRHNSQDEFSGYVCVALGLIRVPSSAKPVLTHLERSIRRPSRAMLIAPAVGWLAPLGAGPAMLKQLQTTGYHTSHCAGLAMGMGSIRDLEFVATLISTLQNQTQPVRVRAYTAAALGRIAGWRKTSWSASLTEGLNYRALPQVLVHDGRGILEQL